MSKVAVVGPPAVPGERGGTGLLMAGWMLGFLGLLVSLILLAWAFTTFPGGELVGPGLLAWVALIGPALGLVGTALVYLAWYKAVGGEDPGALGIVGGALLVISMAGIIGLAGGILAIIGGVRARA